MIQEFGLDGFRVYSGRFQSVLWTVSECTLDGFRVYSWTVKEHLRSKRLHLSRLMSVKDFTRLSMSTSDVRAVEEDEEPMPALYARTFSSMLLKDLKV
jgi:hypothetical protein